MRPVESILDLNFTIAITVVTVWETLNTNFHSKLSDGK